MADWCTDLCGSFGWISSYKDKGHQFGFIPVLDAIKRQPINVSHIDVTLPVFRPPFPSL